MSQRNVETVRQAYEGASTRLEPSQELFAPDWELDLTDVSPDFEGVLRGPDAIRIGLLEYWQTFEHFHIEIEEVIHAEGNQVVTLVRDGGQLKGSDAEVWNRFFHVWTFVDREIVRLSIHTDRSRALEAAGLPGQPRD